jgi:hypothetical protein
LNGTYISALVLFFGLGICFAQNTARSNLEIFEQNISAELEKFYFYPDVNRNIQFVFYVGSVNKNKEEKKFIESIVKKTAAANNLNFSITGDAKMESGDSIYNKVRIDIIKLKTEYPSFGKNTFLGDKTIRRKVISELNIMISSGNNPELVSDKIITAYEGTIPYDNYESFQTGEYKFTQSVPPNISFLETIIFPVLIVTASAIATILFFTIRSK